MRGPSPDGDQAAIVQSFVSGLARTARAIEPPISPNPRNAICISASIAAAAAGRCAGGRSVLPARRIGAGAGRQIGAAAAPPARPAVGHAALRRVPVAAPLVFALRACPSVRAAVGGPGSFGGFSRRIVIRRSDPRRSSWKNAPQRGQRRSSADSDASGATYRSGARRTGRRAGHPGDLGSDLGQAGERGLDLLERVLVVLEAAVEVALVGGQVEVAVAAQVEQDDPRLAGLLGRERLVDRDPDRVGRLGRRQDALGPRELDAGLEARALVDAARLDSRRAP